MAKKRKKTQYEESRGDNLPSLTDNSPRMQSYDPAAEAREAERRHQELQPLRAMGLFNDIVGAAGAFTGARPRGASRVPEQQVTEYLPTPETHPPRRELPSYKPTLMPAPPSAPPRLPSGREAPAVSRVPEARPGTPDPFKADREAYMRRSEEESARSLADFKARMNAALRRAEAEIDMSPSATMERALKQGNKGGQGPEGGAGGGGMGEEDYRKDTRRFPPSEYFMPADEDQGKVDFARYYDPPDDMLDYSNVFGDSPNRDQLDAKALKRARLHAAQARVERDAPGHAISEAMRASLKAEYPGPPIHTSTSYYDSGRVEKNYDDPGEFSQAGREVENARIREDRARQPVIQREQKRYDQNGPIYGKNKGGGGMQGGGGAQGMIEQEASPGDEAQGLTADPRSVLRDAAALNQAYKGNVTNPAIEENKAAQVANREAIKMLPNHKYSRDGVPEGLDIASEMARLGDMIGKNEASANDIDNYITLQVMEKTKAVRDAGNATTNADGDPIPTEVDLTAEDNRQAPAPAKAKAAAPRAQAAAPREYSNPPSRGTGGGGDLPPPPLKNSGVTTGPVNFRSPEEQARLTAPPPSAKPKPQAPASAPAKAATPKPAAVPAKQAPAPAARPTNQAVAFQAGEERRQAAQREKELRKANPGMSSSSGMLSDIVPYVKDPAPKPASAHTGQIPVVKGRQYFGPPSTDSLKGPYKAPPPDNNENTIKTPSGVIPVQANQGGGGTDKQKNKLPGTQDKNLAGAKKLAQEARKKPKSKSRLAQGQGPG